MPKRCTALLVVCFLILGTASFATDDNPDPVAEEWKKLAGSWKAVAIEIGGQRVDENDLPRIEMEIEAGGAVKASIPEGMVEGRIELDLEQTPRQCDVQHTRGPFAQQRQYAIYRMDGEKLVMCIGPPGGNALDRPSNFSTQQTQNLTITFERPPRQE